MSQHYDWTRDFLALPRRDEDGKWLWGAVMVRCIDGVRQYRTETTAEAWERFVEDAW